MYLAHFCLCNKVCENVNEENNDLFGFMVSKLSVHGHLAPKGLRQSCHVVVGNVKWNNAAHLKAAGM